MNVYSLCLAWEWQYDADFVRLLEVVCQNREITLLQITPDNIDDLVPQIISGGVYFQAFLDRASDANPRFLPLTSWVRGQPVFQFNRSGLARRSWDKALMHEVFNQVGLHTPRTIILNSYQEYPYPEPEDLSVLGPLFSIKPAHGGGGKGVVATACSWEQVLQTRQQYPTDRYLLQSYVCPVKLENRPAWFRVIYCCGGIYLYWWDPKTHIYTPLTPEEEKRFGLEPLHEQTHLIARVSSLDLFSTEIAHTEDGSFIVIDYVNDPIDLRPQSATPEGVPNSCLEQIANKMASFVITQVCSHSSHHE